MARIEKLVPDLSKHIVLVQGSGSVAYGVCWVANDDQEVGKKVASREKQWPPLLGSPICSQTEHGNQYMPFEILVTRQRFHYSAYST